MVETGIVISVKNQSVMVRVNRKGSCKDCGRCAGYISADTESIVVEAVKVGNLKIGDTVKLELPDTHVLRLSFLVYMLPLLFCGVGYAIGWLLGQLVGSALIWARTLAVGSPMAYFFWLKQYDALSLKSGKYKPVARSVETS